MRSGRPASWTKEQLDAAINLYKSGNVGIHDVTLIYGIPETTLTRYIKHNGIEITDTYRKTFREKRNEYMRTYYNKNKDTIKRRVHLYKIRNRGKYHEFGDIQKIKVIQHYSSGSMCCSKCSEKDIDILTIDHVNGGGNAHRRQINKSGKAPGGGFYRYLIVSNYPEGFQVLCWNCNAKKGITDRRKRIPLWHQWSEAT